MSLATKILNKIKLYRLKSDEYESSALRDWFASDFDVDVGLYSYGCFDQHRIQGPVRIGRFCSFARSAHVINANHPTDAITTHPFLYERAFGVVDGDYAQPRCLVVSDDVWVGHCAVITPGCTRIGRGAVIGAGAVVTKDVPAYAVVAGIPAREIGQRFTSEIQSALDASRWWELSRQQLSAFNQAYPDVLRQPSLEGLEKLALWRGDRETPAICARSGTC